MKCDDSDTEVQRRGGEGLVQVAPSSKGRTT